MPTMRHSRLLLQAQLVLGTFWLTFTVALALSTSTTSADELRSIALASHAKIPGSTSSWRTWRQWSEGTIQLVRSQLVQNLPTPVDRAALRALSFELGMAADVGTMPSFEHEGARGAYAVDYFCRVQLLSDLLLFPSDSLVETVQDLLTKRQSCRMGSLGGGPGYDFVAAALISAYKSQQQQMPPTSIHATIFDYEEGWSPLVSCMADSVEETLRGSHSCDFETCDITAPLSDPVNVHCRKDAGDVDLWICSYCVAENAKRLREHKHYIFFDELFGRAKNGAVIVFTETTHRLWPDLTNVALRHNGFDVTFPCCSKRARAKRQMVLRKRVGTTTTLGGNEKAWLNVFERDNEMHERKIANGKRRQARKIRGAKG